MKRAGIVLCGGRSSRMGRPKAWLPWFGRTMVEHVVASLRVVVDEVIVVTSAELELPVLPVRIVVDRDPGLGPLAGIRDGLAASAADVAFVTSTDAPYLSANFVEQMFAAGSAAAPVAEDRVQVLSAVYPVEAHARATELLAEGVRRPLALLEAFDYKPVVHAAATDSPDSPDSPDAPRPWSGFNTPEAYLSAVRSRDPAAFVEVELLGRAALKSASRRFRAPIGTLGEVLATLPESLELIADGRVAPSHLVSLGGRDLVRNLAVPVGPGESVSVIDALAGG